MVSCGNCKRCLAGEKVQAPIPITLSTAAVRRCTATAAAAPSPAAQGSAALSYYDSDHVWGEEPLTEAEALERHAAQAEQEEHERRRAESLRNRAVKRRVEAAEKRLGRPLTTREVVLVAYAVEDAERRESQLTEGSAVSSKRSWASRRS